MNSIAGGTHSFNSSSLCRVRVYSRMHKYKMKQNKAECDVIRGNLVCVLFFCCSVTKIYFWHFKTYLVNVFGNADNSIEYRKMLQTFFCERRFESTHCNCNIALYILECGNNVWFSNWCYCCCFRRTVIYCAEIINYFVCVFAEYTSIRCVWKKRILSFGVDPCFEMNFFPLTSWYFMGFNERENSDL